MKKTVSIFAFLLCAFLLSAQSFISTQPHSGKINDSAVSEDALYTAGDDGFVIRWTYEGTGERFQVSDLEVKMIAVSPNGNDIAIYETDGYSINRISVWNWKNKTRKFNPKRLSDSITSLSYSEKGTFLIVGTSSVSGSIFLNANTGSVLNKQTTPCSMVTLACTSATEKSSFMYTQLGDIVYTNMQTGVNKQTLTVESGLTQPLLFHDDIFFAGIKDNYIYIYHAVTGDLLGKIPATSPILASSRVDSNLYYVEGNGRNYTLKVIETDGVHVFSTPVTLANFSIEERPSLLNVLKAQDYLYGICSNGSVQMMSCEQQDTAVTMTPISRPVFSKIIDVASLDDTFYFLSENNVYTSSYEEPSVTSVTKNNGFTNMIPTPEGIVFWSQNTSRQIVLDTLSGTKNLYFPSGVIQGIHYVSPETTGSSSGSIVIIEGSNTVKQISLSDGAANTLYTGSGVQDAVLTSARDLYVAKTSATNPPSALVHVDSVTQETVSLPVNGSVMYALSQDNSGNIFGVNIVSGSTKKTDIFSFNTTSKTYKTLMYWSDEDTEAFTYFFNNRIVTNIGHTQLRSRNATSSSEIQYSRVSALPVKVCSAANYLLSLNKDGSISWFADGSNRHYKDAFLSLDETVWIEN